MINLLPLVYREKLREEQRFRLVLILGVVFITALLALSVFLMVIQVSLAKERLSQEAKLFSFQEGSAGEDSALSEITNWNAQLKNIEKFKEERRSLKEVLDQVGLNISADLSLLSLSYTPAFETKKKDEVVRTLGIIAAVGKAQTREQLLSFKDALQANPFFAAVVFPPSNWVSPRDITFSFQAKLSDIP